MKINEMLTATVRDYVRYRQASAEEITLLYDFIAYQEGALADYIYGRECPVCRRFCTHSVDVEYIKQNGECTGCEKARCEPV